MSHLCPRHDLLGTIKEDQAGKGPSEYRYNLVEHTFGHCCSRALIILEGLHFFYQRSVHTIEVGRLKLTKINMS